MLSIRFKESVSIKDSQSLESLQENLLDVDIVSKGEKQIMENTKDGGLTIGIAVASLALAAISTFINVLNYWQKQYPTYSITIKIGDITYKRENIDRAEFEKELKSAMENSDDVSFEINHK